MNILRSAALWCAVALRIAPRPDFKVQLINDHPEEWQIKPGRIYVVTSGGHQKWAYLRCPADPIEVIQLSLMTERRPNWRLVPDWLGRPTIHPSIWQKEGSYAHFWVRNGIVEWCEGSGFPVGN